MSNLNILIVEDEPMIAEDIAMTLSKAEYEITGIVYDVKEAINVLDRNNTELVLLDINLNGKREGLEIATLLDGKYKIPFVFITSYSDKETLESAKKTNPCGYIVKPFSEGNLFTTIEIALLNFAQRVSKNRPLLNLESINNKLLQPLSEREYEVMKLIYDGKTNQQIAKDLFVSINTIKKHINSAYVKIDATTRSNAIAKLRYLDN